MFAPSHIELSKSAFRQNVKFLRDYIGKDVTFCSVIKGNAYGHGIEQFVPMAEECGISHFAVFSADEARLACKHKNKADSHVMIMGMIGNEEIEWAIEQDVSFYIFELDRLKKTVEQAKRLEKPARIHLHLETGMNRLGLDNSKLKEAVEMIRKNDELLSVDGICTHYAGAESVSNHVRVTEQIENFKSYCSYLQEEGIEAKWNHTACSAATLNYPETIMDMVRIGIAQYGFWPNRETYMKFLKNHSDFDKLHEDPLRRVMSWKSRVMSTKTVDAGEFIGYGTTYQTSRKEKIASVPIGYSHGFKRNLTNIGIVLVNGERAPVAGLVNMNLLTVDVTDIPGVSKGDEVVIIGHQGDKEMSVASFSEMTNYLNYEVLVQIPSRLPRHIVE
ncbi:MAG: alanine racemase [Balneolaceae bacterium]|nr:alanine racemase [Balneolaceae bacterium]